jgi:hypothetical protein
LQCWNVDDETITALESEAAETPPTEPKA